MKSIWLVFGIFFICMPMESMATRLKTEVTPTETYSQSTLLKNWALSVCLAQVAQDERTAEDAGLTASAYNQFIDQGVDVYDKLREVVDRFKSLKYEGYIKSSYNTMRCIDLFHSKDLDRVVKKIVNNK